MADAEDIADPGAPRILGSNGPAPHNDRAEGCRQGHMTSHISKVVPSAVQFCPQISPERQI